VQTSFREWRYVRYFVVQDEKAQEEEQQQSGLQQGGQQQSGLQQDKQQQTEQQQTEQQQAKQQQAEQQQELEQQGNFKQRLAPLFLSLEALKRKDSEAINCIAEEASAMDCTGWFKQTQWVGHLQAYPDWELLAYTIRPPGNDEAELKQVVLAVEDVVEQAVHGLSTLSIDTLRWLKSAKPNEAGTRPLGRMQNKDSQQRAARL
jgi:hypothetical protein